MEWNTKVQCMVIITLTTWTIKSLKKRSYITMVTIKWHELLSFSSYYFFPYVRQSIQERNIDAIIPMELFKRSRGCRCPPRPPWLRPCLWFLYIKMISLYKLHNVAFFKHFYKQLDAKLIYSLNEPFWYYKFNWNFWKWII